MLPTSATLDRFSQSLPPQTLPARPVPPESSVDDESTSFAKATVEPRSLPDGAEKDFENHSGFARAEPACHSQLSNEGFRDVCARGDVKERLMSRILAENSGQRSFSD